MLISFHELIPQLYPETLLTANFHMLVHLSDCVKDWGPLWGYSTFGFENLNGYLRQYAHGTGNILPQLVECFMMHQASNSATTPKENNDETISFIKHLNRTHNPEVMKKCKQVLLPKDEMDALFSSRILSPGCDMHINTVPSFKFNNVEIKPRAMLFNRKRDSSVFKIKWNDTMLFISVRRLCLINGSITGIGNVLQCMQHNVFDAIGKPSVKNQTLENRSSLINRYIYKVRKLSLSNTVVAFPVTSILQQLCVHVPVKHSETDFILLQPNPFEHH